MQSDGVGGGDDGDGDNTSNGDIYSDMLAALSRAIWDIYGSFVHFPGNSLLSDYFLHRGGLGVGDDTADVHARPFRVSVGVGVGVGGTGVSQWLSSIFPALNQEHHPSIWCILICH